METKRFEICKGRELNIMKDNVMSYVCVNMNDKKSKESDASMSKKKT